MVTFDEAYGWLNESDNRSYLSIPVQQIVQNMRDSLTHGEFSQVHGLINLAIQVSKSLGSIPNDLSRAETYLECARIHYEMGDITGAVTEFRQAASLYVMGGHQHNEAVARWLLGCAFWRKANSSAAIVEWEKSCLIFQQLRNFDEEGVRYESRINQMHQTLQNAIIAGGWFG